MYRYMPLHAGGSSVADVASIVLQQLHISALGLGPQPLSQVVCQCAVLQKDELSVSLQSTTLNNSGMFADRTV